MSYILLFQDFPPSSEYRIWTPPAPALLQLKGRVNAREKIVSEF